MVGSSPHQEQKRRSFRQLHAWIVGHCQKLHVFESIWPWKNHGKHGCDDFGGLS